MYVMFLRRVCSVTPFPTLRSAIACFCSQLLLQRCVAMPITRLDWKLAFLYMIERVPARPTRVTPHEQVKRRSSRSGRSSSTTYAMLPKSACVHVRVRARVHMRLCLCASVSLCLCVSVPLRLRLRVSASLRLCVSASLRLCVSMSLCLCVSVSACLPACLGTWLSACLPACLLPAFMSLCLSACLPACLPACPSVCPSVLYCARTRRHTQARQLVGTRNQRPLRIWNGLT